MAELPDDPFVPVVHTVLTTAMIDIQRRGYLLLPLFQSGDGASDAEVIRSVLGDTQLAGIIRETTSAEAFTSRPPPNPRHPPLARAFGTNFTFYSLPDWEPPTPHPATPPCRYPCLCG